MLLLSAADCLSIPCCCCGAAGLSVTDACYVFVALRIFFYIGNLVLNVILFLFHAVMCVVSLMFSRTDQENHQSVVFQIDLAVCSL